MKLSIENLECTNLKECPFDYQYRKLIGETLHENLLYKGESFCIFMKYPKIVVAKLFVQCGWAQVTLLNTKWTRHT